MARRLVDARGEAVSGVNEKSLGLFEQALEQIAKHLQKKAA